jgi:hypothetical protein
MTTERIFAALLAALFACFLLIALNNLLQLFESRRFADAPLLLYCAVVCVGWIAFLVPLSWPVPSRLTQFHFAER